MKLTSAQLVAWQAVAHVLADENDPESVLLPDIVEAECAGATAIGSQPGAFDAELFQPHALALYAAAMGAIGAALPKLLEGAIDITKDMLKERLKRKPAQSVPPPARTNDLDLLQLRKDAIQAAEANGISPEIARKIGDAVVVTVLENASLGGRA